MSKSIKERLEYLRGELQAERISYGELAELQDLIPHIDHGDVELMEYHHHQHQWYRRIHSSLLPGNLFQFR